MLHLIGTIAMAYILYRYIAFEKKASNTSFGQHGQWVAAAMFFQLTALLLSQWPNPAIGNIILHSVGGGVVTTMLFFYLKHTFFKPVNWRLEVLFLIAFVSVLGNLNEVLEYAGELAGLGLFSVDTHDVWRDIVANTTGALVAWVVVKILRADRRYSKPRAS